MKRLFTIALVSLAALSTAGCSMFYPNWGATELPTATPSSSATESATPSETASPTSTPTDSASPTPTSRIDAEVQILDASADATAGIGTVIAQVNNVTESTGTCTATIKAGGIVKKFGPVQAEANAASTQCFAITFDLAGLPSGAAAVQVSYDSPTASGKSNYFSVTIP